MSGFAGIVRTDGGRPDQRLIESMAESMKFRGPDATQIWSRPGAAFCFTLLRTGPSPQASAQPCSLDEEVWLLGDVRLDGSEALRRKLQQLGETPDACATNEELILRAWRLWAEKSLEEFIGDFSFALWDVQSGQLWCARSLLGARPFFYSQASGQLIFSNTLNSVRLSPEVSDDLDLRFIGDFLLQSWCADPDRTAFRDVRRLPAGHLLHYSRGEVHVRRFASLPIEDPLFLKSRREYVEIFRSHLQEAVRDRLPEAAAAVFMSGGLDSTSVAAVAANLLAEKGALPEDALCAYTVDYNPLFDDHEGKFASLAAHHIGIPIEILSGSSCAPFTGVDDLSLSTPEPWSEPFFALHVEHYRQVATRSRVVLSGDGGDDILTGRAWPYFRQLLKRGRLDTATIVLGSYVIRHGEFPTLRAGLRSRLRRWVGRAQETSNYPPWLDPGFEKELHLRDRWLELQQPARELHPLHPAGYASLSGAFWSNIFEGEDASWTGIPVEARAPLLDLRLIRFLLRVPPMPWCMHKELLREAMRGLLPEEVRTRRKTPLRGDPLLVHIEKNGWEPVLSDNACESLQMFVNCRMHRATSHPALGSDLWADIRPLALNHWLKSVENSRSIQYIRIGGN